LGAVSYSPSIVTMETMAVSLTVYEIFSVKKWHDLENWVRSLFKVIENGAVRYIIYDFLLVHHCKYSSILYRFLLFDVE